MQEIEPSFQWENIYDAAKDKKSPFLEDPILKPNMSTIFMAITFIQIGTKSIQKPSIARFCSQIMRPNSPSLNYLASGMTPFITTSCI